MRRFPGAAPWLAALGLLFGASSLQAAVMTSGIRVTSGATSHTISYFLAQDVSSMTINIRDASTNAIVKTLTSSGGAIPAAALTKGAHTSDVTWDGSGTGGQAPAGQYYAEIVTSGGGNAALTLLSGPTAFAPRMPDQTEARGLYGGDVNKDPTSPYHNQGYFAVTETNASGSAGLEVVQADASSTLFPLPEASTSGAYDYVSASVLSDSTILTGGQSFDRLADVSPETGDILKIYAAGKVAIRTMRAFGAGDAARVYYIDDSFEGVSLLDPLTADLPVNIIPGSALPDFGRGLAVKKDESALYVCGYTVGTDGSLTGYIKKFTKSGTTWTADATFTPPAIPAAIRGIALSPDDSILWVSGNSLDANGDAAQNRVFGLNANTGAALDPGKYEYSFSFTATPQGIGVAQTGNLFVEVWNGQDTGTTANAIAVLAPPDSGSTDTTRGTPFVVTTATAVQITSGPTVTKLGRTSATIEWDTNVPSDSVVTWDTTSGVHANTETRNEAPFTVLHHSVTLFGLAENTTYYYDVSSNAPGFTAASTTEKSFTTLTPTKITGQTLSTSTSAATLTVTANKAAEGTLHYGTDPASLGQTVTSPAGTTTTYNLSGLSAGTTYYYKLDLSGAAVEPLTTPVVSFTTEVPGGTATTVTQSTPQDLAKSSWENLLLGSAGSLLTLQRQGLPAAPVTTTDLPEERYYHGVAIHNGYIYVIGGRNNLASGNSQKTVYYAPINADGTVGAWKLTAALPDARIAINNMTFGYNGYLYVVGGANAGFVSQKTVYYARQNADGTLEPWKETTPLPELRDAASAIPMDGYVVFAGGEDNDGTRRAEVWIAPIHEDGTLGAWYPTTPLLTSRWFHRGLQTAHKYYSLGGYNELYIYAEGAQVADLMPTGQLSAFADYTNSWDNTLFSFAAGLLGGKIVVVDGRYGANIPTDEILWAKLLPDATTGPWNISSEKLSYAGIEIDGKTYNGRFYTVGGRTAFAGGAGALAVKTVSIIAMTPDTADPDGATYAYSGSLEAPIIDLGAETNLRHITVTATNANVEVRYRYALTSGAFSDWFTPSSLDADISGGARYVQYELVLKGDGKATPTVNSIAITTGANTVVGLPGDVDKNGVAYEKNDAILALKIVGGLLSATDPSVSFQNADVDGSGHVDMADATAIWRKANGK